MRTGKSIKNSFFSVMSNGLAMLFGFISQAIFIRCLGAEYLGLNGLFSNILTMLSFLDLGLGTAIIFNLYKPLANGNQDEVRSLMLFYKKSYNIIGLLVLLIGIAVIPFLNNIVGNISVEINIYIIYMMFLANTVCTYLMVYKRSIIFADQKNYIISFVHILYIIIMNLLQILLLILYKNYYLFLAIKIICQILENFIITRIANKMYPNIFSVKAKPLDKDIQNNIYERVKALIFHKVGVVVVNGTDNIIISKFFGVIYVGLYSNYYLIINSVNKLFAQVITATTASVGNLLVLESKAKSFQVFRKIRFINFCIALFSSMCILTLMEPFISLWVGEQYKLLFSVLVILVIQYFQDIMRNSYNVLKDGAGICIEDRHVPILESLVNIVSSIILLHFFGLGGVFLGTIVSSMLLWMYSYPKFVYTKLFDRNYLEYYLETFGYFGVFGVALLASSLIIKFIVVKSIFYQLIINFLVATLISIFFILLFFFKSDLLKYVFSLVKKGNDKDNEVIR